MNCNYQNGKKVIKDGIDVKSLKDKKIKLRRIEVFAVKRKIYYIVHGILQIIFLSCVNTFYYIT